MSLLDLVKTNGKLGFNGNQPPLLQSKPIPPATIHNTYSINGNPVNTVMVGINGAHLLPNPSKLDLGTLSPGKYMDNPPH